MIAPDPRTLTERLLEAARLNRSLRNEDVRGVSVDDIEALARYALGRDAECERLREALVTAEEEMSRRTSDIDFRQMTGLAPAVVQARNALPAPPRGAAIGDDE